MQLFVVSVTFVWICCLSWVLWNVFAKFLLYFCDS